MKPLVFLKLGGSAITDKTRPYTARKEVIRRLAKEVKEARLRLGPAQWPLVLGHGSGSFGHYAAKESGFGEPGKWNAFAETGAAASRLNRLVADLFLAEGVPVVTYQPSASARYREGRLLELATEPIEMALEHNLVPLVHGDVAFDGLDEMTIISTEMIFAYLAPILSPSRILLAGAVDGVFTADPIKNPQAVVIPEITPASFEQVESRLFGSHGFDVTGGMLTKVKGMMALIQAIPSIRVYLFSALKQQGLFEIMTETGPQRGTVLHA